MEINRNLPTCCQDMDIDLIHLVFPEQLGEDGKEFVEAHGLMNKPLSEIIKGAQDLGNGKVKIFHRCDQLEDNGRCAIYENRPQICRNFGCSLRHDCACKGQGKI